MEVEQLDFNAANLMLQKAAAELANMVHGKETLATEAVLTAFPKLVANREAVLELIYTEYVLRQEQGTDVSLKEWESRFPQWTSDLRELFEVHEFLSDDEVLGGTRRGRRRRTLQSDDAKRIGRIGNCELLEEIGRGGMGVVYRARQMNLDRVVAVKTILACGAGQRSARERFNTEVEAVARLQHPHIVQIHEVGDEDGVPYFTMEFVSGGNLADQVRERPLSSSTSARLVECLARAVHYAHSQGVVHRDLKPENILLTPSSRTEAIFLGDIATDDTVRDSGVAECFEPKITDFGLAKRIDSDLQQTVDGAALGTPGYMAPEQTQIESSKVGAACDVYSLGAVLYRILVGRPPFHSATVLETINQVRSEDPISPRSLQRTIPRDLETICLKCLQKQPERRYPTAFELADDLRRFQNGEPIHARPTNVGEKLRKWARRHPSIAALFVVLAVGVVGVTSQWMRAEVNRATAQRETIAANHARNAEQFEHQRAVRTQYAHDVQLAQLKYESNNTAQAMQLLDACPAELRHWEWYFVRSQCQKARVSFPTMSKMIRNVAWSPDGRLLAAVSGMWGFNETGLLNVWETDTGRLRFSVEAHAGGVLNVEFNHDSTRVVTAGATWQGLPAATGVKVWDADDGSELLAIAKVNAFSAKFSPDDRMLAVARSTGAIGLHDSNSGEEIAVLNGHSDFASDLAFRPDGKYIASAGRDGTMRVWDLESHQQFAVVGNLNDVRHIFYLPDGKDIVMGTFAGVLKKYRQRDDGVREVATLTRATTMPMLQPSPDGQTLAVAAVNQPVILFDIKSEVPLRELPGHNGYVNDASFSPDGRRIATAGADGVVTLWDWIAPVQPRRIDLTGPHVVDLAFDPVGDQIALASRLNTARGSTPLDRVLRFWDVGSRRVTRVLSGHDDWLTSVAFHPLGSSVITGSDDKTVRLWDPKTGQMVRTFVGHDDTVTSVAFVGDDVASSSRDGTIRRWNAANGEETMKLIHEGQPVIALAARRDGLIASVTANGALWIWDGATGSFRQRIDGIDTKSAKLAFSPDGSLLAIASDQPTINLWDTNKLVARFSGERKVPISDCKLRLVGHTSAVTGISFSPDGNRLASTSDDRYVKIWDVVRGTEVLGIAGQLEYNTRIAFSPDGDQLVQSGGSILFVWGSQHDQPIVTVATTPEDGSSEQSDVRSASIRDWHYGEWRRAAANKNWYAAAFHRNQLHELDPDEPHHVTMRGVAYAELGRLDDALSDWDNGFHQFSKPNALVELSYRRAIVRLLREDSTTYQQICQQLWEKHSSTDNEDLANSIAWTCSLGPDPGVPADDFVKLAKRGVAEKRISARLNTLGACLYRAKRYEEAIETLDESIRLHGSGGWPQDWAFLALSQAAIGKTAVAREYLDKAIAWLAEQQQLAADGEPTDAIYTWATRVEMEIVIREAHDLLAINNATLKRRSGTASGTRARR